MKSLLVGASGDQNCYEFAHIHFYKLHLESQIDSISSSQAGQNPSDDGACHEGKTAFGQAPLAPKVFSFIMPEFKVVSDWLSGSRNNFKSPYLEPHRKPPKAS